ncbi:transaldolase [Nesterenkonia sp. LB17]|uniref:transaldolase n=1 Tax=unclassified Nesterenkonia TaxID=2629769 RepID=UPI001F4C9A78|nr:MULTISPECIES: transaldolase [unclassified Nesterenkonia]MCH8559376.1 transaldolase [Nesterenkonia sp. DZ6]MCH8563264.1 transaldolase [Nesterenkonia sp. YGD6]MCH8564924.1 transaldolase [Nesterenkonia sp. LB17]MCH8571876.1 transaldolase [Nesterenkonia sp. AY15]
MTANKNTQALSDLGVSIWLDDLSRERLNSGSLAKLIETHNIVGVTTNPTIFESALKDGEAYEAQLTELAAAGADAEKAVFDITTADVREACDVFAGVYAATDGVDGRVSIEVDPRLARDAAGTIAQARELYKAVDRENVLIKIPATVEGIEAIAAVTAEGISVNVTLVFSLERYRAVINAFMLGLEKAHSDGIDISKIHSVASFFVSRVDAEIDKRLELAAEAGKPGTEKLKSQAAVANARLAHQIAVETFSSERWQLLAERGGRPQRLLLASTGTKDPNLSDTLYVTELAGADVVNTMPEKTLLALADHGVVEKDTLADTYVEANRVLDGISAAGISYREVVDTLETEGLQKFEVSWTGLLGTIDDGLKRNS